MHRKVIMPRAVGYLIPRISAGAISQSEQWSPKICAKYTRKLIISDRLFIYSVSGLFCSSFSMISSHNTGTQCGRMPLFSITLLFFPRRGAEVSKTTFMQHRNSIKISTNEMFTSMAAGAVGAVARSSSPGEPLALSDSEEIHIKRPSPCTIDSAWMIYVQRWRPAIICSNLEAFARHLSYRGMKWFICSFSFIKLYLTLLSTCSVVRG